MSEELNLDTLLNFPEVDDGQRGPQVREFIGTVLSTEPEKDEKYDRMQLRIVFENLEIIEAVSPYDMPIFEIVLGIPRPNNYGKVNKSNAFVAFMDSIRKLEPGLPSFREIKGKRYQMKWTEGHMLLRATDGEDGKRKFSEYAGHAWEATELIGGGKNGVVVDAQELLLSLLDGKTKQQFNIAALKNDVIKQNGELKMAVANGKWIKEQEEQAAVVVGENGVYTVVR